MEAAIWLGAILLAVIILAGIIYVLTYKKHDHSWKRVSCSYYESITGPRTVVAWYCKTGGETSYENIRGIFTMKDFE